MEQSGKKEKEKQTNKKTQESQGVQMARQKPIEKDSRLEPPKVKEHGLYLEIRLLASRAVSV